MSGDGQLSLLPDPREDAIGYFHAPASEAPETEREAAIAVAPRTGTARWRVLVFHGERDGVGATDDETSVELGMRLYTAAPRRKELVDGGWLCDSGRRRPTETGARAVVWTLTDLGRAQLPELLNGGHDGSV